ncbi:MAG: hypothetical protein WD532_08850 [Acidimicrobiia bacterium]
MTSAMVTVRGTEPEQIDGGPGPRWRGPLFLIMGLVAGLTLGALFTGTSPGESPVPDGTVVGGPEASPTTTLPLTTTTTDVAPTRLATMVPGMLDVLVASAVDRNGRYVVTAWQPSGRSPIVEPLPWGNLAADASHTWLATSTLGRWAAGRTLWIGNAAYMEPVTSHLVFEPVWHARLPGHLAWIEDTADGRVLKTAQFVAGQPSSPRTVVAVDDVTSVAAWTDAGIVTQRFDSQIGTLEVRDETGAIGSTREIAAFLGAGRHLMAVIEPDGGHALLDLELSLVAAAPWGTDCHRAVWGLYGLTVAVHCGFGNTQRFEYWQNPLELGVPSFLHSGREYTDFGLTSTGVPYVTWIESLRPSSTILFHLAADGSQHEITYPGLIESLQSLQG